MKTLNNILVLGCMLICAMSCNNQNDIISIIPKPSECIQTGGYYKITTNSIIHYGTPVLLKEAEFLQQAIRFLAGTEVGIQTSVSGSGSSITLKLDSTIIQPEGYKMDVTKKGITIAASTAQGIFYGIQTLIQTSYNKGSDLLFPIMSITDFPRFAWRGMHFDVSRHFLPKEFMYKLIDLLAMYKLNVLHWHLVDDQGWRIEIKKYPKLTEIAAWREGTPDDPWNYYANPPVDGKPKYGGFYTQEEIKQIVAYAAQNHITIVPEIEMPGHSFSVLNAYPEFSCTGKLFKPADTTQFEFTDPYCAGNKDVYRFLKDVLEEVIELFPSEYIHLGGDEAKKDPWMECSKCKQLMRNEGLKTAEELQSYFMRQLVDFLHSKGRKTIGWDEIIDGPMPNDVAVMAWRGEDRVLAAIEKNHPVVNTNIDVLYFNMAQTEVPDEKYEEGPFKSLEKVYNYNPLPNSVSADKADLFLGVGACLWSEQVFSVPQAERRLLPRLMALSEISWSSNEEPKNFNEFSSRVLQHFYMLDRKSYDYFIEPPTGLNNEMFFSNDTLIKLESIYPEVLIAVTLDNSEPDINSTTYTEPIKINSDIVIKARLYLPNGKSSQIITGKVMHNK